MISLMNHCRYVVDVFFFFQAEDGIRDVAVTGVQTCALPIYANAASYVHELTIEDIKVIFSNALSFKPQREINILFSGGEPTVSPIFLDAVRQIGRASCRERV